MKHADIFGDTIATASGDVLFGMKQSDAGYTGFGEPYFSWVSAGAVKALEAPYTDDDECGSAIMASAVCISLH